MGAERTRLCLQVRADAGAGERLSALLSTFEVVTVILAPGGERPLEAQTAKPLVEQVQRAGVAALILADARLARTLKADGVHVPVSDDIMAAYEEARGILGRGAIVGADAGRSRHDAMSLGEAGADYVGFGVPAAVKEQDKARERQLELVSWWAEIFEVPCVAFDVTALAHAEDLARSGADFVAVSLADALSVADAREHVSAFVRALAAAGATVG